MGYLFRATRWRRYYYGYWIRDYFTVVNLEIFVVIVRAVDRRFFYTFDCCVLPQEIQERFCNTTQPFQSPSYPQKRHFQCYKNSQNSTNSDKWHSGSSRWPHHAY